MDLTERETEIWKQVRADLAQEPVASPDHVERMTTWCQRLGPGEGADMEVLVAGALLHDVGVVIDRKAHFHVGKARAGEILEEVGFPSGKVEAALHVLEAHSRYGGPSPTTVEARVGHDADALEYLGAIGILRALVRGLKDGSFSGDLNHFPRFLRSVLAKVEGTFHTERAQTLGRSRLKYMREFLDRMDKELDFQA